MPVRASSSQPTHLQRGFWRQRGFPLLAAAICPNLQPHIFYHSALLCQPCSGCRQAPSRQALIAAAKVKVDVDMQRRQSGAHRRPRLAGSHQRRLAAWVDEERGWRMCMGWQHRRQRPKHDRHGAGTTPSCPAPQRGTHVSLSRVSRKMCSRSSRWSMRTTRPSEKACMSAAAAASGGRAEGQAGSRAALGRAWSGNWRHRSLGGWAGGSQVGSGRTHLLRAGYRTATGSPERLKVWRCERC